jgi:hypothetical protein
MAQDFALRDHQEWINYLQPEGLVVSARALVDAQTLLDNAALRPLQEAYRSIAIEEGDDDEPHLRTDPLAILCDFLGWPLEFIDGTPGRPMPTELVYTNEDLGVRITPTYALRTKEPKDGEPRWMVLVQVLAPDAELDRESEEDGSSWKTTPSRRFERLLRETKIPIGLVVDERAVRLIYAPPHENTGTLTFPLAAMAEIEGRKILGGFHALLSRERLFIGPVEARLPALLEKSRKAQASVSTALSEQVLESLYELVRGFQAADARAGNGDLLRDVLTRNPDHVYQGLLNVLLRLITLLYAEDRGMLPQSDLFVRNYSLRGLFERLRIDYERYPDTMDHRYGAWNQLLVVFRLVDSGCAHAAMHMPARRGGLFGPGRFPFLEGRTLHEPQVPLVSDGTVFRVLSKLLIVDGERLSYRTLDVEHIGSVYETMMGFRMERATGRGIALKPKKTGGAPTTIDLDALLKEPSAKRAAWIKDTADQKLDGKALEATKAASTIEALVAALDKKIARTATPDVVAPGSMVLQPSDERRKSGSHYTPRSLTEPIVRKTLEPIFARLGADATPEQVLGLSVCDPAMGSGAFLVEACRQLAARVEQAWERHRVVPTLPLDEDLDLYAMRLVARRCLYGVDKNPVAVDLAKLSLWLATLARDHAFTFLDHALKCGDSLVGLDREQLASFHWKAQKQLAFVSGAIGKRVEAALELRDRIRNANEGVDVTELRCLHADAEAMTADVRLVGDLAIAAFFSADSDKKREAARKALEESVRNWLAADVGADTLRARDKELRDAHGAAPFHWWLEFPERFAGSPSGFDAFCGNPPFMSGTKTSERHGISYFDWLTTCFPPAGHQCDLSAYFLRRCFDLCSIDGAVGLLATNTIAQGDSREGGLLVITRSGGEIFCATRRFRWPGTAAVICSAVHVSRKAVPVQPILDGKPCERISAYLLCGHVDESPFDLATNPYYSAGTNIYSQGFLFDDSDPKATPLDEMRRLLIDEPSLAGRIRPYMGGQEINTDPQQRPSRFVIYLSDVIDESRLADWPRLTAIVREKVKPGRDALGSNPNNTPLRNRWWAYQAHRPELYARLAKRRHCLALSSVSAQFAVARLPTDRILAHTVSVLDLESFASFAVVQSCTHECWTRFLASSMKDDLRYTPADCFVTFPFPPNFEMSTALEMAGRTYHEFRAELMVRNNEGLTKTYNRYHAESEMGPDIYKLRELHAAMDRAVLNAYPELRDIQPSYRFIADYTETDDDGDEIPKSIRYRWPDEFRDEVLTRLLALNRRRYDEEVRMGLHAGSKLKGTRKATKVDGGMFDEGIQ